MKKISIIIAGYNCAEFITRCLDSIFSQTYTEFEVIFVDDGSTDSTADTVYMFEDPRLKYIYEENSGVSAARNKGIQMSTNSEYMMFVDADDWLAPECLSKFVLQATVSGADYVFSDWFKYVKRKDGLKYESCKLNSGFAGNIGKNELLLHFLRSRSGGAPWAKLFKTELIKQNSIRFQEGLPVAEDYLFNIEYLTRATSVYYLQDNLYIYNCCQMGARGKFRKNRMDITLQIEERKKELVPNPDKDEEYAMLCELIEQIAAAIYNLGNSSFTNGQRFCELKRARTWWKKQHISFNALLRADAGTKSKIICVLAFFGV